MLLHNIEPHLNLTKMKNNILITLLIASLACSHLMGQESSGAIYKQLEKLNFLGSALYIAAHPDDENTALISYFSNHVNAHAAYLSMTRGDGGQNRIGTELRELLGVIRTEELMQARSIDNGNQYFTSAVDFGFSKHPDETLAIWDKKQILGEVVNRIRSFQPDIIVNRFDHRTAGRTHGHHTSSALLSREAFALSNDPKAYPEQLNKKGLWQPQRLFFNTSWWFYGSQENFKKADNSNLLSLEIGVYDPLTGISNAAIAAASRSSHKSQGFGSAPTLGSRTEYIEIIDGKRPLSNDPFEGINTTWSRLEGGTPIGKMVDRAIESFDFKHPEKSIEALVRIHKAIEQLPASIWKERKLAATKQLLLDCAGVEIQFNAERPYGVAGESLKIKLNVVQQSKLAVELETIKTTEGITQLDQGLETNKRFTQSFEVTLGNSISTPYWLLEKGSLGTFKIENKEWIGKPQTPNPIQIAYQLNIAGTSIAFEAALLHRKTDPVRGEVINPFYIVPALGVTFEQPVFLYANDGEAYDGAIELCHPKGWEVDQETLPITLNGRGSSQFLEYQLKPTAAAESGYLGPLAIQGDKKETVFAVQTLSYTHIPKQYIARPSEAKVVRLDLKIPQIKVGYIAGAGDTVKERLQTVGLSVESIDIETTTLAELKTYDAILVGIRAYNVIESLAYKNQLLFNYAEAGGTLVTQYNTSRGLKTKKLTPLEMKLSRDRVTDEFSTVRILEPKHPALNVPHKITAQDFEGWVQERGLYFPNQWDERFTPLLGMNDAGETEKLGSILVAPHGKGTVVYTGLSFFRELPAGVPGAYRLLINLLAL
jgi:LmbE family N-acetylglucosaminyl deacetylase